MKYINERTLRDIGIDWTALISVIEETTGLLAVNKFSQPLKPYLRFDDPVNRIIAMPAYVGGGFDVAGIKWIASFPGNLSKKIKRAHSVIVLNDTETGKPTTLINTALISAIRTASVSGFILKKYLEANPTDRLSCGIIGFGPIGQLHLEMLQYCWGELIDHIYLYDINPISSEAISQFGSGNTISVCESWKEVYEHSRLFVTCTVSKDRYVNAAPKKGGIYLNVSLRDFQTDFLENIDLNVVDNWVEICRENTDIENAHLQFGLSRNDVLEITEILDPGRLFSLSDKSFMFNPMGMAVYDMAVAKYYSNLAVRTNNYVEMED